MARGINKVILIGNVGQQPEIRTIPSNSKTVANLSLATSESWKDKQTGEQKESAEWHKIVFYDRLAEVVRDYVNKGSKIYVEGKLKTRTYEKDGVKHYVTEIIANEMQMLDSRGSAPDKPQSAPQPATQNMPDDFDDDIPF